MPDFLKSSACNGRRPHRYASRVHRPRPALTSRLLRERHVPRFIVAPHGYGKTGVALDYAGVVFGFEHVYWIDGLSPCFLRDLDAGVIAEGLLSQDASPFLAVFEDVPLLDSDRSSALCEVMDALIARECEVIFTCSPACDAYERQRDRVVLTASDLLLTDEEVDQTRSVAQRDRFPASQIAPIDRVAVHCWGDEKERSRFLRDVASEDLPPDVQLVSFCLLTLESGTLDELHAFGDRLDEALEFLAPAYAHLGIDLFQSTFHTIQTQVKEIADAFGPMFDSVARRSLFTDEGALAAAVADALLARGESERACEVARLLMPKPCRADWLERRSLDLEASGTLAAASSVNHSLSMGGEFPSCALMLFEACRRLLLDDVSGACAWARRVAKRGSSSYAQQAQASLILGMHGLPHERENHMRHAKACAAVMLREGGANVDADVAAAVNILSALSASPAAGARTWALAYEKGARGRLLFYTVCEIVAAFQSSADCRTQDRRAIDGIAAMVCDAVNDAAQGRRIDLPLAVAVDALSRASAGAKRTLLGLDDHVRHLCDTALEKLSSERLEFERMSSRRPEHAASQQSVSQTVNLAPLYGGNSTPPLLTVNLFGGLEVRLGDTVVDPARFNRKKVRTLLALLVLNRGKEAPRERLAAQLWPDSDPDLARRNFYGIWSLLRRGLTAPDGSCPYLIAQQNGLRLEPALLKSDVFQFGDVCRALLFERADYDGWNSLYERVDKRFSDDLLPSEQDNADIEAIRSDCRARLVDALVSASARLVAAGNVREGLWFARAALAHDRSREDSYTTLMRCQIAAGQRTAALETYFACRRFLTDELGIDPSAETMRLYRDIIESEEDLSQPGGEKLSSLAH